MEGLHKRYSSSQSEETCGMHIQRGSSLNLQCTEILEEFSGLFGRFAGEKAEVLSTIGLGGLTRLPGDLKVDPKFALWLLMSLDTEDMCLNTPQGKKIPIRPVDVHFVLGLPYKGYTVVDDYTDDPAVVRTLMDSLSTISDEDRLSISCLVEILSRDYYPKMQHPEREAFKIASVLLAVAGFIAPKSVNHRFPLEVAKYVVCAAVLKHVNWSQYLLDTIKECAIQVKLELSKGVRDITMYGCMHFLQVFYLDNLDFGVPALMHDNFPRIVHYSAEVIRQLIATDRQDSKPNEFNTYGRIKVRGDNAVCYSRKCVGEFTNSVLCTPPLLARTGISSIAYRDAMVIESTCLLGKKSHLMDPFSIVQRASGRSIERDGLRKRAFCEVPIVGTDGDISKLNKKKKVLCHSVFVHSPFSGGLQQDKVNLDASKFFYRCLEDGQGIELDRDWFIHGTPSKIVINGHSLRQQFLRGGTFSVSLMDALMRLCFDLDWLIFGNGQTRWRHFLPATWAASVLSGRNFLNEFSLRQSFIGDHVSYDVENCTMIIAPVHYNGRWSCYFWDMKERDVTVLDPCMMQKREEKIQNHHIPIVEKLHRALLDCIDGFFDGWEIHHSTWQKWFPNDVGPRCRPNNSGLYVIHYARQYDGLNCEYHMPDDLGVIRGVLLFKLLALHGNSGKRPTLLEDITTQLSD